MSVTGLLPLTADLVKVISSYILWVIWIIKWLRVEDHISMLIELEVACYFFAEDAFSFLGFDY